MINICYNCGEYSQNKVVDLVRNVATCPIYGYDHHFKPMPLLIVGGASGTGKSTVCQKLFGKLDDAVILEGDILWRPEFNTPDDSYHDFFNTWLRLAKNISQAGKPVVLFNAGMGVPGNIESLEERRFFSDVYYLALVCDDRELENRLKARPAWRKSGEKEYIEEHIKFNQWIKNRDNSLIPRIEVIDNTNETDLDTTESVVSWIKSKIHQSNQ